MYTSWYLFLTDLSILGLVAIFLKFLTCSKGSSNTFSINSWALLVPFFSTLNTGLKGPFSPKTPNPVGCIWFSAW